MKPCKHHTGRISADGYGRVSKGQLAHRVAYCEHHGLTLADIKGQSVRHECDNPPCVEPEHLLLGTHTDNMQDKVRRGRNPMGSDSVRAKLTTEQVHAIRAQYVPRHPLYGARALAREYGIAHPNILRIINGEGYSNE